MTARFKPLALHLSAASLALLMVVSGCAAGDTRPTTLPGSTYLLKDSDEISQRLKSEKPYPWTDYTVIDENTLKIDVWLDSESCNGARAEVNETPEAIEVSVFTGYIYGGNGKCILLSKPADLVVATKDPIGDRKIIRP